MGRASIILWCLHVSALSAYTHREHKVHNIILYPDEKSWCNTTSIKQIVGDVGCEGVEVENNVCVGCCFSYNIPRTEPTTPGQVQPYCDSCQPSEVSWKHITLKCKGGNVSKRVEIIENCTCSSCDSQEVIAHVPHKKQEEALDVPQLINLVNATKNANAPHLNISHERLSQLLKFLENEEEDAVNQGELKEFIAQIKGDDENINRNALEDIAYKAEEMGHIKVDIGKLHQLLAKMDPASNEKFPSHRHHHHHHHHVHGPHHSKVLEEDRNPTLDMEPQHLKPALEGSEITYHAHHHNMLDQDED